MKPKLVRCMTCLNVTKDPTSMRCMNTACATNAGINERGKARNDHPDTSHEAADLITGVTGKARLEILTLIRSAPTGLTDEQLFALLDQANSTISPNARRARRGELVEKGYVKDSGKRRRTTTGRQAIVWAAV